jgi:hypothetical protein
MTSRTRVVRTTGALTLKDAESPSRVQGAGSPGTPPRPLRERGVGGEGAPSLRQDAEA